TTRPRDWRSDVCSSDLSGSTVTYGAADMKPPNTATVGLEIVQSTTPRSKLSYSSVYATDVGDAPTASISEDCADPPDATVVPEMERKRDVDGRTHSATG